MYFVTSHLWPAGCSTVHAVSVELQPLMALHSKHPCCRYDDGTCSRGAVPSQSPDTDTLNGNGKCDWGRHLNYCVSNFTEKNKKKRKSRSAKKSELRSNVWVIGGNRSEVLLVLTKSSWLEGMTTHFQTDESAKGPRPNVLFYLVVTALFILISEPWCRLLPFCLCLAENPGTTAGSLLVGLLLFERSEPLLFGLCW